MEGRRSAMFRWLTKHGETETPVSTITFFAVNGLLDDCILQRSGGKKKRMIYDTEKTGKRILWIREKQRVSRLRIDEIKELIKANIEKAAKSSS